MQSQNHADLQIDERRASSDERAKATAVVKRTISEHQDRINSWEDLIDYCVTLPYPVVINEDNIKLINVTEDHMIIDFSIIIDKTFKVKAYKQSTVVNIRHLIDVFNWRLALFPQVNTV